MSKQTDLLNLTDAITVDSANNVGIGTSSPATPLDVTKAGGGNFVATFQNTTSATPYGVWVREPSSAANGYPSFQVTDNAGTASRFRVDSGTGNVYAQGIYDNPTSGGGNVRVQSNGLMQRDTSSLRYKNSVQDATHGLSEVLALRPVTYKGNNDGDTVFGGLIAEEVHDVGLTEFVDYDDQDRPDALRYAQMVSLCIKAIQEQQATITALETRITALEAV